MRVSALPSNTGNIYIGVAGMNKTTLAGVVHVLGAPLSGGVLEYVEIGAPWAGGNGLRVSDLRFDSDVANEGVLVACFIE